MTKLTTIVAVATLAIASVASADDKKPADYKAAWDLDGHWVVAHFEGKMEGMPGAHKGLDVYGWDPINKMYVSISVDNMGGWSMSKSKGWEGDKQEWAGKGMMMGKESDMKW